MPAPELTTESSSPPAKAPTAVPEASSEQSPPNPNLTSVDAHDRAHETSPSDNAPSENSKPSDSTRPSQITNGFINNVVVNVVEVTMDNLIYHADKTVSVQKVIIPLRVN